MKRDVRVIVSKEIWDEEDKGEAVLAGIVKGALEGAGIQGVTVQGFNATMNPERKLAKGEATQFEAGAPKGKTAKSRKG